MVSKRTPHNAKRVNIGELTFSSIREASKYFGLNEKNVRNRLKLGWTVAQAFGVEKKPEKLPNFRKPVTFLGLTFNSQAERDRHFNLPKGTINKRLFRGWTEAEAAGIEPKPHRHRNIDGSHRPTHLSATEIIDGRVYKKADAGEYRLYRIKNNVNGKVYIGITTSPLKKRLKQHFYNALQEKRPAIIYRAIRKYGVENFSIELVRDDAKNFAELLEQERHQIKSEQSVKLGYNSSEGGEHGSGMEITIDGKTFPTHASAADFYDIEQTKFNWRLRNGYSPEQAAGLEEAQRAGPREITVNGIAYRSLKNACEKLNVSINVVQNRLKKGWSPEEAFGFEEPPEEVRSEIQISINEGDFKTQNDFCLAAEISDAVALKRRKEGWSYQEIWNEYANGGRERICPSCSKLFRSKRRDKNYCSRACIIKGRNRR